MDADLDTLATALYARTDDLLKAAPERLFPAAGAQPSVSPNGNFVAPEGTAAVPPQSQARAKALGRPRDPRD